MTTTGKKLRMGALFGGRSEEHEVSLASATSIMGYIDARKYEVIPIGLTRSRKWLVGTTPADLQAIGTRVSFFLEKKTGRLFINEVNTWPSFTQICMYPRLCAESGLPYP
ncbi:MAG TPA: hypothetical protein VFV38_05620 [Ktedonobacteraceae bacterium]|nr:hypothetical protein [Ktedonobacteraceae bacterium]